jgi:hypothetical protein
MKMKDLDSMEIEKIIRLPFFYSLEKDGPNPVTRMWKITFRCNKVLSIGLWGLLDAESETEFIVRYKVIDINYDK